MIKKLLTAPLKLLPQPLTAVGLGVTLNLFFQRYPELKERMIELSGKLFLFSVEDHGQSFYMTVDETGEVAIHTYSDAEPNVTMAGSAGAFLALLFNTTDPDSLFFSRQLKLSGETDTGLRFKNILDNVEIDWERELASLVGKRVAELLLGMAQQVKNAVGTGKERAAEEMETLFEDHETPKKEELESFTEEVEALSEESDKLEKRIARLSLRLNAGKK